MYMLNLFFNLILNNFSNFLDNAQEFEKTHIKFFGIKENIKKKLGDMEIKKI